MEERGLRRCAGQSGHRRFIGADMVSWIEIKNECSDHVNYKLAEKEKTGCFHASSFFLYFITSGSGKKLIQSNCLKNCAENQTGCLKKEKVSYE